MKCFQNLTYSTVLLLLLHVLLFAQTNFKFSEDAYRANNRGVSLLEQFKSDEAEKEFRQALKLKPDFKLAKINLAIALFNSKKLAETRSTALEFLKLEPNSPQALYILGLTARSENQTNEALNYFRKVLELDKNDVGANVNLGQMLALKREYAEAIKVLEVAYKSESFNLTAIYNLATSLQRSGERERAAELLKKFQVLRDTEAGVNIGLNYLEQGRYAEALASTGAESELVDNVPPKIIFQAVNVGLAQKTQPKSVENFGFNRLGTGATLFDYDGDGDLDLVRLNNFESAKINSFSLFRNDKGKFTDTTILSGGLAIKNENLSTAIIAGDFDNDNLPDLFVVLDGSFQLFRNLGNGKFVDVSKKANLPKYDYMAMSAAFADADHDGDLDIFVVGFSNSQNNSKASANMLLRNNGDSTFTDISNESKINHSNNSEQIKSLAVVPTDFNNSRDIDFLVLNLVGAPILLSNQRDDTFQNVAENVGLNQKSAWSCVAAGDFNKDSFTDFFLGKFDDDGVFAISDGRGKFVLQNAPKGTKNATSAQFIDYDNDGLLDLIVNTNKDLVVSRNLGKKWSEAKSSVFKVKFFGKSALVDSRLMLSGDIDNDGDIDLFTYSRNGELVYLQNVGGNLNNAEMLNLQGRVSNKSGIGARIMMRAGSLSQQLESYSASPMPAPSQVHFGLGKREKSDSIRILWSSGIVQSETDFAVKLKQIKIQEVDRKPASCPYLYTWDGEKFVFITDFLGGGEMGGWAGKGAYNFPDSDEFVRIPPHLLKPKNGFYEIRVTNELEEVMYLDKVKLVAVEHDANSEIYPNEGLGQSEKAAESIISTQNATAPISATTSNGENALSKIKELDRNFYDDFKLQEIRGYAETHNLTLNLDDKKGYNGRTILLLTGWTDYAFSSDNLRASQSGKSLSFPSLQVKNKQGAWQTVIDSIGIPVGRPQTLTVDLTGKFLTNSREVRIVTNFRTYWDKIAVDTSPKIANVQTIELEPTVANLQAHGFGKETKLNGMIVPDYKQVSFESDWKDFAGRYTRFGDVKPLLAEIDDTFVIAKAGDEFVLSFKELPAPPKGKTYTFLLFADGYSKEADINSGSPDVVYPLPFKKMTKYPYGADEKYPMTDEKRKIYDETLTRFSRGGLAGF